MKKSVSGLDMTISTPKDVLIDQAFRAYSFTLPPSGQSPQAKNQQLKGDFALIDLIHKRGEDAFWLALQDYDAKGREVFLKALLTMKSKSRRVPPWLVEDLIQAIDSRIEDQIHDEKVHGEWSALMPWSERIDEWGGRRQERVEDWLAGRVERERKRLDYLTPKATVSPRGRGRL